VRRLTIGEMAKLNNISSQTLRYYDQIGLIHPEWIDDATGYRYYDINQSAKLDLIYHMKSLGMSLESIRQLFEKKDIRLIEENIEKQLLWISEKKREIALIEKATLKFKHNIMEYREESQKKEIEIRAFSERKIFCFDGKVNIYESDMRTYEFILRKLKKQVMLEKLPVVYFCNVGSIIRKENILKNNFYSTEIFVFLDDASSENNHTETIPAGSYACISFKGEEGFSNEQEYAQKLFDFISENDLEIDGDYICEVITELPFFCNSIRNMFIRLQIPIKV